MITFANNPNGVNCDYVRPTDDETYADDYARYRRRDVLPPPAFSRLSHDPIFVQPKSVLWGKKS